MMDFGFSSAGAGNSGNQITEIRNIDKNEILSMGSSPISLLPNPDPGTYYVVSNIIFEYSHGSLDYKFDISTSYMILYGGYFAQIDLKVLENSQDSLCIVDSNVQVLQLVPSISAFKILQNGKTIYLSTNNFKDLVQGDGRLRAIITFEIRTWGA